MTPKQVDCRRIVQTRVGCCTGRHTLSTEELSGDVQGLAADDNDLLAGKQLLGNDACKTTQKVTLAIDDDLDDTRTVSFLACTAKCDVVVFDGHVPRRLEPHVLVSGSGDIASWCFSQPRQMCLENLAFVIGVEVSTSEFDHLLATPQRDRASHSARLEVCVRRGIWRCRLSQFSCILCWIACGGWKWMYSQPARRRTSCRLMGWWRQGGKRR